MIPYDASWGGPGNDPTVRWGDAVEIPFGPGASNTADLMQVQLEFPALCRVQMRAEIIQQSVGARLARTQVLLIVGCGSQSTEIRRVYNSLPQVADAVQGVIATPLDCEWYIPLNTLRGRMALGSSGSGTGVVRFGMWITPVGSLGGGADAGAY